MIKLLLKTIGVSKLLGYAWDAVKPELLEWAQSDGEKDWDDALVEFLDNAVKMIIGNLEEQGK